jgi:hypothetical protein
MGARALPGRDHECCVPMVARMIDAMKECRALVRAGCVLPMTLGTVGLVVHLPDIEARRHLGKNNGIAVQLLANCGQRADKQHDHDQRARKAQSNESHVNRL